MSLLPKSAEEFQLKQYWDKFFTKRSSAFEWYGEYTDLCHVLHKYLKPSNKLLVVGCGNSKLSEALYDVGFHCIDNIDISDIVVRQMTARNKDKRPVMTFTKMDMLSMSYENSSYDCILDKGTLDAIFSNTTDETLAQVDTMFNEIERVLKTSGRYICITLAQDHILDKILKRFDSHWLLRVHRVLLSNDGGGGVGGALPVFVFVLTKMMKIASRPPVRVFEYMVDGSEECVRCEGVEGIASFVKDNQQYALVSHHLSSLHPNEPSVTFDLWSPSETSEPRYTLSVIDRPKVKVKNGPFAVFIAPQGKETDWLFSCDYGRSQLADSAGFERLVIVTLHRGHTYASLDEVKEEVSGRAVELVQSGVTNTKQYPVLTLGDGLGSRVVLQEGSSTHTGQYVVEECTEGVGRVRRLVFVDTPHLAQTEMRLTGKPLTSKKSKKKTYSTSLKVDHTCLLFDHHKVVMSTLTLIQDMVTEGKEVKCLLVGLGGGALPMYMEKVFNKLSLDVVELDPEVIFVAEKWFGVRQSERMRIHVGDGVQFVRDSAEKKSCYDVMILDVDCKDRSVGVSSPPPSFTTPTFLFNAKEVLHDNGIFVTNLAARNKDARNNILSSLAKMFINVWTIAVPEDINEIVVASPSISSPGLLSKTAMLGITQLSRTVCKGSAQTDLVKEWTDFLNSAIKYSCQ